MALSFRQTIFSAPKAQAAIEYMVIVSFALIILTPLVIRGWRSADDFNRDLNLIKARDALSQISDAAKIVYFQGPPSTMTITVMFPDNIASSDVSGNEAYFRMRVGASTTDVVEHFGFNVTGNISGGPGERTIYIEAQAGTVNITRTG